MFGDSAAWTSPGGGISAAEIPNKYSPSSPPPPCSLAHRRRARNLFVSLRSSASNCSSFFSYRSVHRVRRGLHTGRASFMACATPAPGNDFIELLRESRQYAPVEVVRSSRPGPIKAPRLISRRSHSRRIDDRLASSGKFCGSLAVCSVYRRQRFNLSARGWPCC